MISVETKKRYSAFWSGEAHERCCLYLCAPKKERRPVPVPRDVVEQWEDMDFRFEKLTAIADNTLFLADAFPNIFTNFGPGSLTACIGGSYRLAPNTVWFENEPVITDWDALDDPVFDPDSKMARLIENFTEKFIARAGKDYLLSVTDIGGTYDIVAAMRGTQDFLMDLICYPEQIEAYVAKIQPIWRDVFLKYSSLLMTVQGACTSWIPVYSDKPYFPIQCDMSAMISPDMFRRFILPDLEYQTSYMERSVYHLDGVGELPHLDMLLSMPRLSAIQWVPGAGQPDPTDECWFDLYKRIQSAGKGLVLTQANCTGVEKLLQNVSTKGLFISTDLADADHAADFIKMVDSFGVK